MTEDVLGPRPGRRASIVVLAVSFVTAAGLYALVGSFATELGITAIRLPVLYAVGVLGAWLVAYLVAVRAQVLDSEGFRWIAWAYALVGLIVLSLAVAAPGFVDTDVRQLPHASPNGGAALRLLIHGAVAAFVIGALRTPQPGRLLRTASAALVVGMGALVVASPAGLPPPQFVTPAGTYTALYVGSTALFGALLLGATVGWLRRIGVHPNWTEAWVALGLVCFLANLAVTAAGDRILAAGWWSGLAFLLAGMVVPAIGLLGDLPRQMHDLHQHSIGLRERLDRELRIALPTVVDPSAAARLVTAMLEGGAFRPVFQPIFALDTMTIVGVEALTRFHEPSVGTPDVWFGRAREAGLSVELEMATARTALTYLAGVPDDLFVAINMSPTTVQRRLLAEVLKVVPAKRLVVEVTEHEATDSYEELNEALHHLRAQGVRMAVDDAGAGFSSLRHIVRTEPDIIKLDVSLIRDLDDDPVRRALTSSLVAFASQIGSVIVAEGIETLRELDVVRELGVGFGQGFYLAHPGSIDDLMAHLADA